MLSSSRSLGLKTHVAPRRHDILRSGWFYTATPRVTVYEVSPVTNPRPKVTAIDTTPRMYPQSRNRILKPLCTRALLKPRHHNSSTIMVNILSIVAAVTALMSPVTGYLLPSDPRFASEFVNAHNRIHV